MGGQRPVAADPPRGARVASRDTGRRRESPSPHVLRRQTSNAMVAPAAGCDAPPLSSTPDGWERAVPMEAPFDRVEGVDREVEPQAEAPPGPLPGPADAAAVPAVPVETPGMVTRLVGLRRGEVRVATAAGICRNWANHFCGPGLAHNPESLARVPLTPNWKQASLLQCLVHPSAPRLS